MSQALTFNPDQSRTLDKRVERIDVNIGSLLVTEADQPILVEEGTTEDFSSVANLTLYSPNGARAVIYYFDEADSVETPRGDSGGSGGSYESRTVTELRDLAKERGIEVKGKGDKKPVKADYIKALRD
jgi:hypothetical protein